MDHIEAFRSAMRDRGIEPPPEIVADGKLQRFTVPGDRAKSENGFYVLHADEPIAGSFGSWKLGINETWCYQNGGTMSPEEKAKFAAKMAAARRQQEEERKRVHAECRAWCADAWAKAKEATNSNPYLQRKGVNAYGLRAFKDSLLVPVKDIGGTLHGLQFISPDGSKKFKTGTNKHGHFCTMGKAKGDTVVIAEGYATAASIHQATGHCVLAAFDAGNLKPVAEVVRLKRPGIKIIIAADNDQFSEVNAGVTKGTEAARAVGGFLAVPVFQDTSEKPTDMNDLHRLEGLDRVREIIKGAAPVVDPEAPASETRPDQEPEATPEAVKDETEWEWPEPLH
ncbi:partial DNA primase TraC, partial [Anaerolineae bacterium]